MLHWILRLAFCSYYLMTRAAEPNLRHEVTEVLDAAVSCGLTAIRTWAFCEGKEWNALQPSPGMLIVPPHYRNAIQCIEHELYGMVVLHKTVPSGGWHGTARDSPEKMLIYVFSLCNRMSTTVFAHVLYTRRRTTGRLNLISYETTVCKSQ